MTPKQLKTWFVVTILAALIALIPLMPALQFVARQKGAVFPAVIAQRGMSQMVDKRVEVALGYLKKSLLIAVAVNASVSLIDDVRTDMFAPSLLYTAEPVWPLVGIPMSVVIFVSSLLIIP